MTRQEAINFLIRERKQCLGAQAACVNSEHRNIKRAAAYKEVITMLIKDGDKDITTWQSNDFTYLCQIPDELGSVTGFRVKDNKVIADTESGTPMILPTGKKQ